MTIRVGDIGKPIVLWAQFDLSAFTALSMVFTKPDLTQLTVTPTAPAVPLIDPELGTIPANEYWQYITIAADIDQVGTWTVCATYDDASPSHFSSAPATFEVLAGCS